MKVISFDIGIKNMAYCVFILDVSNSSIIVQDWRVINLMDAVTGQDPSSAKPICGYAKKVSKNLSKKILKESVNKTTVQEICGHKAQYAKMDQHYCAKHARLLVLETGHQYILPDKSISIPSLKKLSKTSLIELCKTWSIDEYQESSIKPLLLDHIIKWFSARVFEPLSTEKRKTASETDLITIGRNMKTQLQSSFEMQGATHVIMENQISPLAGRMKTIQGMLAQYFIMQDPSPHIEFISSANKLKDFLPTVENRVLVNRSVESSNGPICQDDTKTLRQIYTQHKSDAVSFCRQLLQANPDLGTWTLENTSKKDDLADCFLQGIWYLKHIKYIMCADNLKINLV
jgi:hypothetical protein